MRATVSYELDGMDRDAHAVIREAKNAGVYVFGGGIDETAQPVLVLVHIQARRCQGLLLAHCRNPKVIARQFSLLANNKFLYRTLKTCSPPPSSFHWV